MRRSAGLSREVRGPPRTALVYARCAVSRDEVICYTDGSCKAAEGAPGGWGFVMKPPKGPPVVGWGSAKGTLAKVMEYRAVAEALAVVPEGARVVVMSDNQALVEALSRSLPSFREAGFANVDPLVVDSVRRIDALAAERRLTVRYQWVRGHSGNAGNERADALAAQGARAAKAELTAARPRRDR